MRQSESSQDPFIDEGKDDTTNADVNYGYVDGAPTRRDSHKVLKLAGPREIRNQ